MNQALDTAVAGDTIEARELPLTCIRRGYGWVRTWDGRRCVYVVRNESGAWVVREIEVVALVGGDP
jgi:hypothetical protein